MAKKNIIVCHFDELPPAGNAVAIRANYFLQAINQSEINNQDFLITTTTRSPDNPHDFKIYQLHKPRNKSRIRFINRIFYEIAVGFSFIKKLFFIKKNIKLIILSSPGYIGTLIMWMFCRFYSIEYAIDIRDLYPKIYSISGLIREKSLVYKLLNYLTNSIYRNANFITTPTKYLYDEISKIAHVDLVYNGFPSYLRNYKSQKYKKYSLVFHGNLGMYQDIGGILALASRIKDLDIDFHVIGFGPKASAIRAHENIIFHEELTYKKTLEIVSKCHLGISFRTKDIISRGAFPVKVWEYIGLNIPIIITPISEAGEFVENNKLGWQFEDVDTSMIMETIQKQLLIWNSENPYLPKELDFSDYTREYQSKIFSQNIIKNTRVL